MVALAAGRAPRLHSLDLGENDELMKSGATMQAVVMAVVARAPMLQSLNLSCPKSFENDEEEEGVGLTSVDELATSPALVSLDLTHCSWSSNLLCACHRDPSRDISGGF